MWAVTARIQASTVLEATAVTPATLAMAPPVPMPAAEILRLQGVTAVLAGTVEPGGLALVLDLVATVATAEMVGMAEMVTPLVPTVRMVGMVENRVLQDQFPAQLEWAAMAAMAVTHFKGLPVPLAAPAVSAAPTAAPTARMALLASRVPASVRVRILCELHHPEPCRCPPRVTPEGVSGKAVEQVRR